uniref:Uncharacterized protein n=1 Tax=Kwoniella pini CBS 10737 TaxID=1296096 RepID=A0A1B9I275_9TREE|nr:uncharacterized protein I206_04080 [Kwoniella pini CBS 10737]OCF49558.1 hypothetical protein I206_04080 [Kwoniella pini CBS 10737]
MSLSDLAEPSSTSSSSSSSSQQTRINLTVPTSLLILPPTAAIIGLSIGLVRGGNKSRLRFLAENAHRQPKTIQGWYFYTKTRNYRVFFGAAKTGSRFALGLGGATAVYVLLDESIGFIRERLVGVKERISWRNGGVAWEDGALSGGIMGLGVGTIYRLPRPLFIRSIIMGTILGALTSTMQVAQAHIGRLRQEEELKIQKTVPNKSENTVPLTTEEVIPVSAPILTENQIAERTDIDTRTGAMPVDLIPLDDDEGKGWFSRLRSALGV